MAHDTNNALAAILANLELAERYAPKGKAREAIARAVDAARLHAALLPLHAPEARRHAYAPEPVDVGLVVDDIASLLTRVHGGALRLETELPAQAPPARIEANLIQTVVAGLVCSLNPEPGEETILRVSAAVTGNSPRESSRTAADGGLLNISIRTKDDGGALVHAWGEVCGSGGHSLLASVVRLVSDRGGSARLSERDAGGAQIVLRLPLDGRRAAPHAMDAPCEGVHLGDGELILLVGEDAAALEQLHRRIEGLGYGVASAAGEAEALAVMDTPEAIVLLGDGAREQDVMRKLSAKHPHARTILLPGDTGGDVAGGACSRAALALALGAGAAPDQASLRTSPAKT
jgi:CheY-like chemotaxis protein